MPRIPDFSLPQVSATAPNMPAMQAPSITPMRDFSAEGVQAMTTGLSNIADLMIKTQNHIDDARVRDADSDLADFESQQIGQLRGQKGMSAVKSYGRTIKSFNDKRDEIAKSLDNDIQRQMFQGVSEDRSRRFNSNASEHFIKESRSADIASTSKRVGVRQRDAMLQQPGTSGFSDMMNNLDVEIDRLGELNGWDEDVLRDEKRKRRSDVYDTHVRRLIDDGNISGAFVEFNKLSPATDIEPEAYAKLGSSLRRSIKGQIEMATTNEIIKQDRPLMESLATLREAALREGSPIDSEMQNRIETNLRQHDQDKRSAAAEKTTRYFAEAQDFLQKNPSATIKDLEAQDSRKYEALFSAGKIDALQTWMDSGHRFPTDPQALLEIDEARKLPPGGKFVAIDRSSIIEPLTVDQEAVILGGSHQPRLDEMTQAEIRARWLGRISDAKMADVLKEAADAPERRGGSSDKDGSTRAFNVALKIATRRLGYRTPDDKPNPEFSQQSDRLEQRALDYAGTESVIDLKTGSRRKPNDAEIQLWFAQQSTEVGLLNGHPVTRAQMAEMTQEQLANIEVQVGDVKIKPSQIPAGFAVNARKELGSSATDLDIAKLYLQVHGKTPQQQGQEAIAAAEAALKPPAEEGPVARYVARQRAMDTAIERYEQKRDESIAGAAEKGTAYGMGRTFLEGFANAVREGDIFVAETIETPVDYVYQGLESAVSASADAVVNVITGAGDLLAQARDWAFGTDAAEPKYLPGSDRLNPAYLQQVKTFASFETVPRATTALWKAVGGIGWVTDPKRNGEIDKATIDAMKLWAYTHSTVNAKLVDRIPMGQRQRILIDLVRASKDGAKLSPYLDVLERELGLR